MSDLKHFKLEEGRWHVMEHVESEKEGTVTVWVKVPITDVPLDNLFWEYENLVKELSMKEVELYNLKEAYLIAESKIVNETDFKALYGANNQKVRDNHVKNELSDMVSDMKALEFGIGWIRSYIPLLKEVIRVKQ